MIPPEIDTIKSSLNFVTSLSSLIFNQKFFLKIAQKADFYSFYEFEKSNFSDEIEENTVNLFFKSPKLENIFENLFSPLPHELTIQEIYLEFSNIARQFFQNSKDESIRILYDILICASLKFIEDSKDSQAISALYIFRSKPDFQIYSSDPNYLSNFHWNNETYIKTLNEEPYFQPFNNQSIQTPERSTLQIIPLVNSSNNPSEFQFIRNSIENFNPSQALEQIQIVKDQSWESLSETNKGHLLSLEALAYFHLNNHTEASRLFLQSYLYNKDDKDFIRKASLGFFLIKDYSNALKQINAIIDLDTYNQKTYSLYIQIKSHFSNIEDIIQDIPQNLINTFEVEWAIGLGFFNEKKYLDAETWLTKALNKTNEKSPFLIQDLAYCLINNVYSDERILCGHQILQDHISNLEKAIQLFNDAWGIVQNDGLLKKNYYYWILEIVKILGILNRKEEANDYLSIVLLINENDEAAQYFKALNKFEEKNFYESENIFKNLLGTSKGEEALWMYLKSLESQKKIEEGINYINSSLNNSPINEKIVLTSFHITFLLKKGVDYYSEAYNIAKNEFETNSDNFQCLISYIKVLATIKSEIFIEEICTVISNYQKCHKLSSSEKFELADLLFDFNIFCESAKLYFEICEIKPNSKIIRKLLISLFNAGEFGKTLTIIDQLHSIDIYDSLSSILGIKIFHFIGDLANAQKLCIEHLQKIPDDDKILFHLAYISFFRDDYSEVDQILEREFNISLLDLQEKIQLVNLYYYRNNLQKAILLAYSIRDENYDDGKAHDFYINFFLIKLNDVDIDILKEPNNITEDCIISLKIDEEKNIFNISNLDDRFDYAIKIRPDEFFQKKIIGLHKGSTFNIENIINKFQFAFIDSKLKMRTLDPNETSVKEIIFKEIDPDTNIALIKTVEQLVDKRVEGQLQIINSYNRYFLPIGSLILNFHLSIFELLNLFKKNKEAAIKCSEKEEIFYFEEMRSTLTEKSQIIIDIGTLISFFQMDLHDNFYEIYGKFGISQSTRDLVLLELFSLPVNDKESISFDYDENGELRKFVHSIEEKRQHKEGIRALLKWIDKNCTILPVNALLNNSIKLQNQYKEFLDKSFFDTLYLSSTKNNLLISDDLRFRAIAEQDFESIGISSQVILLDSYNKQIISEEKYHDSLIFLITSHYSIIFFDGNTLYRAAQRSEWNFYYPFSTLLQLVSSGKYSPFHIITIFYQFIRRVCLEKNNDILIISLIYLFSHIFIRYKKEVMQKEMLSELSSDLSIPNEKIEIIISYIDSWS